MGFTVIDTKGNEYFFSKAGYVVRHTEYTDLYIEKNKLTNAGHGWIAQIPNTWAIMPSIYAHKQTPEKNLINELKLEINKMGEKHLRLLRKFITNNKK